MSNRKKNVIITGVTGQDGSYLAKYLLEKNYKIYGVTRNIDKFNRANLEYLGILNHINIKAINLKNYKAVKNLLIQIKPLEIYNLSGVTSVSYSFSNLLETFESIILPTQNFLESIRSLNINSKYYNSCSSECYGNVTKGKSNESNLFKPVSPYGLAKQISFNITKYYREKYNIFSSSGISYNHESPLRGKNFICKKIISEAIKIKKNKKKSMEIGNLNISRDWGWAPDFVRAYSKIIKHKQPTDFVICSDNNHSLKYIINYVFSKLDLDYKKYVKISKNFIRENDIIRSAGDNSKIISTLNWEPSYKMSNILDSMIENELKK